MGTIRLIVDRPGQSLPLEVGVDQLQSVLAERDARLWVDLSDPTEADVDLLRDAFGVPQLALEEVCQPHERPRCDAFGGYYFIVVYAAEYAAGGQFSPRELNLFWGDRYLVSIHRRPAAVLGVLDQARGRWQADEARHEHGIASLVYNLFDSLVHGYFVVQDRVRERIEVIEHDVFEGEERAAADLFRLRKGLLQVPRLLAPTGHILAEVLRRDRYIPADLKPYFGDVQDHAVHVLAEMDTYRDLLQAALDVQVFYSFNRLGITMKRLTAVTVIIMVPNFVASIYGMNFAHMWPPSEWRWGFLVVVALLGCMVAWGFIHSRILKWL